MTSGVSDLPRRLVHWHPKLLFYNVIQLNASLKNLFFTTVLNPVNNQRILGRPQCCTVALKFAMALKRRRKRSLRTWSWFPWWITHFKKCIEVKRTVHTGGNFFALAKKPMLDSRPIEMTLMTFSPSANAEPLIWALRQIFWRTFLSTGKSLSFWIVLLN